MIKNAFWNALSILVFLSAIAVMAFFALIFLNPYSQLNPFPPPTKPAALNLPTFTPTFPQLPPTWTPGGSDQEILVQTLKPSSTSMVTEGVLLLLTKVPISTPTRPATTTPTQTPTSTLGTRTPTETPNRTNTALAQIATNAALTAQARTATSQALTATAQAGGPGATQTVAAMPPNPNNATETSGAISDTWQSTISDPAFTWSAVSGASGYYIYWGSDPNGTSASKVTTASYDPPMVTIGTYYLRLRTIFPWGERPNWTTAFIFRFDNTNPNPPVSAVETHGAVSGTWQGTISDPAFTWSGANDTGSGIARYDVYFGSNPNGTFILATPTAAAYDPAEIVSGNYYLRVRSLDAAGNLSSWVTLFIFRYDGDAPSLPGSLQTADLPTDPTPTFTWSASTDSHSGLAAYEIFWGAGAACAAKNQPDQANTSFTAPEIAAAGDYSLCVRARDNVGNTSNWAQTTFTYTP